MRSKKERVRKQNLAVLLRHGTTHHTSHLLLRAIPGKNQTVSFIAPKKLGLMATRRNLLRRRGYAAFKTEDTDEPQKHTLIFFFKKGAEKLSFVELCGEVRQLLDKAERARYNTR